MSAPLLLAMPANELFARKLAPELNAELGVLEVRRFPDRESYVRIHSEVSGRHVAFVCSLRDPDGCTLPLLFAARTAKELGATNIGLIAPYLSYMRQDHRFNPGEAISSIHYAELLSRTFDWLVTVDPHLHRWNSLSEIYTLDATLVHAAETVGRWIRDNVSNPALIGPDSESRQWVELIASTASAPFEVLSKTRHGDRNVSITLPDTAAWKGRTPVLVDDIISSAHTMITVLRQWNDRTLPPPICVGVHAVFADDAHRELLAAGTPQVVTTNSIEHESNRIDICAVVASGVRQAIGAMRRK